MAYSSNDWSSLRKKEHPGREGASLSQYWAENNVPTSERKGSREHALQPYLKLGCEHIRCCSATSKMQPEAVSYDRSRTLWPKCFYEMTRVLKAKKIELIGMAFLY